MQRHAPRQGQATIEFALVMMFGLLAIIFGTIEIGRGIWYYTQVSQLAREGARALIVSGSTYMAPDNPLTGKQYLLTGNWPGAYNVAACSACGPTTAVGWIRQMDVGIPHDQLSVEIQITADPPLVSPATEPVNRYTYGMPAMVRVTYPYRPVVAEFLGIPATITLRSESVMHLEEGRQACDTVWLRGRPSSWWPWCCPS